MDSCQRHAGMTDSVLTVNGYELPCALARGSMNASR